MLTVPQVFDLARGVEPRFKALLLLAVFGNLRWGAGVSRAAPAS